MSATAPPTAAPATGLSPNRWLILVIACLAQFMVVLDITIVNIALPSVQRGLDFSVRQPAVGRQRLHARSSAASCCSAAAPRTCSVAGACSSPA